jgi:hypothetical protein
MNEYLIEDNANGSQGPKDRPQADEKKISKLMKTETVPKHRADEKLSMSELAKMPSEPRKSPSRK